MDGVPLFFIFFLKKGIDKNPGACYNIDIKEREDRNHDDE